MSHAYAKDMHGEFDLQGSFLNTSLADIKHKYVTIKAQNSRSFLYVFMHMHETFIKKCDLGV